jgi:hypothetical protein
MKIFNGIEIDESHWIEITLHDSMSIYINHFGKRFKKIESDQYSFCKIEGKPYISINICGQWLTFSEESVQKIILY